ncbi:MAG: hypothetical protein V1862_09595, partial [Methanobacteriota archaeon]
HGTAEDLAHNESYRFQLEIYRRAAEILGMVPIRSALYSVYEKKLIDLEPWTDKEISEVLSTVNDTWYNFQDEHISW